MGTFFGADTVTTTIAAQYGATLYAVGGPRTISNKINLGGYGTNTIYVTGVNPIAFTGTIADNVVTFADNINLNGAQRTIQVVDNPGSAADGAVLSGVLSGAGNSGILKTGGGSLTLSADNFYTGPTTVAAGALLAGNGPGTSATGPGAVNVAADADGVAATLGGGLDLGAAFNTIAAANFSYSGATPAGGSFATALGAGGDINDLMLLWTPGGVTSHLSTWTASGGGNWGDANWDNGAPNAVGDTATFHNSIAESATPAAVLLKDNRTVSELSFASTGSRKYEIANAGSLTVAGTVGAGGISGAGETTVDGDLTANSIVQDTLSIGAGRSVTIRETPTGGAGAQAVPEPSVLILLLAGAAGLLTLARRRVAAGR